MFKYLIYLMLIGLLITISGCITVDQLVSWSSDSRYVMYTLLEPRNGLWVYDTKEDKADKIELQIESPTGKNSDEKPLYESVIWCKYIKGESRALIVTAHEKLYIADLKKSTCRLIDTNVYTLGTTYNLKGDDIFYYVKSKSIVKPEGTFNVYSLMEDKNNEKTHLFTLKERIKYPEISPDGRYILYVAENSLSIYDLKESKSSVILDNKKGEEIAWPQWVNKNEIIFLFVEDEEEKNVRGHEFVTLRKITINNKTLKPLSEPVVLQENIYPELPGNVSEYTYEIQKKESQKKIKITEPVIHASIEQPEAYTYQPAVISLKTGEVLWKNDTTLGGLAGKLSPDGQKTAYISLINESMILEIQDIKTRKRTIVWQNEAEKFYAEAEALKQAGKMRLALDRYRSIIEQYPDSNIVNAASYNMAILQLKPELLDLDAAYESVSNIGTSGEIPPAMWKELWRSEDFIAEDPPEDWIQTYGTDEASKQFEVNTDLTRDLRGLWMRKGKKYIYIRVDYGLAFDVSGLTFQDTLLLFDYNTTKFGSRSISGLAEWDKTADRKVMIRHWFESEEKSQYDVEIQNETDEVIHKYLVSGFSPADNPLFKQYTSDLGASNSVVYAVSKGNGALDLDRYSWASKINIQVCTFKGGIESQKKLETPRFDSTKNLSDVADTFGKENNLERIKADKKENPDKPIVIKGYAGTLELTQ